MGSFTLLMPCHQLQSLMPCSLHWSSEYVFQFASLDLPKLIMLSVFPGGILPTLSLLIDSLCSACKGKLVVDSVNNIGPHYARTLREWCRRFLDQFDDVIVPALKPEYPSMVSRDQWLNEIEVFKRKWLCECADIGHLLVLICFSCRLLLF